MYNRLVEIFKGGSKPSMDEMLEDSDRHLENFDTLILPAPESKPRTPFNSDVPVEEVSILGGITDYVYLAELAGLGAIGYHGLLISPGEGARLRINTIYTNITNLPTPQATGQEHAHLSVRDFCAMCKKCVRKCPVEAIFDEPQPRGDGGMQTIEHATCRDCFTRNYGCAVCLAVCPFSQVGYEKVQARFKGNPDAPQFRIPMESIDVDVSMTHMRNPRLP